MKTHRKHRHRWLRFLPQAVVELLVCKTCGFRYEQGLLFDAREYESAA